MRTRAGRTKFWQRCTGPLPILLGVLAIGGLLLGAQPASAVNSGPTTTGTNVCLQPLFSGSAPVTNANRVGCTANDIRISGVAKDSQGNPRSEERRVGKECRC